MNDVVKPEDDMPKVEMPEAGSEESAVVESPTSEPGPGETETATPVTSPVADGDPQTTESSGGEESAPTTPVSEPAAVEPPPPAEEPVAPVPPPVAEPAEATVPALPEAASITPVAASTGAPVATEPDAPAPGSESTETTAGEQPAAAKGRDDKTRGSRSGRRRGNRKMRVPQLDLRDQHQALKREIAHAIAEVINSGGFVLGPKVAALEEAVAHYSSARHGIGVASGTDALLLSLRALGIGPGDEVITSAYSFIASAGSIALTGAKPVFVDIDPESWNMDPAAVEAKITEQTKAIMPVHLFGQCMPMDPLLEIAARHNLAIVEDAAQALGAEDNGRRAGSLGTLGCFSFYPTKNLGAMGDGGMIVTNDQELADRLRLIRVHGAKPKYVNRVLGTNSRLDAMQAAVLIVKLQHLEQYTEGRRQHARVYNERLKELACTRPSERPRSRHIYNQYAIRVENRDQVAQQLKEKGIDTAVYYPIPLHLQEVFADLGHQAGDFPHAEEAARSTLCLPIFPELSKRARDYVTSQLAEVIGRPEAS